MEKRSSTKFIGRFLFLLALISVQGSFAQAAEMTPREAEALFVLKVKPLLHARCVVCHGKDGKLKGGLDLQTRDAMLKGGDSDLKSLVPGKPEESLIYIAATWKDPDWEMPPKENDRLNEEELSYLHDWIQAGAPWSDQPASDFKDVDRWSVANGVQVVTSGGLSDDWTHRRYSEENLWAYQPVKRPSIPGDGDVHPVDAFVGRKLDELGLEPAPASDRRTLIRRVSFDLIGLPPTPAEVNAFLNDPSDDQTAFMKVVDRLLASPHYGEQWGRHWLDVVRYADSSGFANDYERPHTWRYRDYVVRSFNQDKPYDQFVKEQIAGDELDPNDPEMLIAVGFLRMGPWELTGMEVAKVARQRFLDDVTDSVGQVFLSHPLQCAKCHDHKFDPIPTRDYYRIQSVFKTTQFANREAAFLPDENLNGFDEVKYLRKQKQRYQQELKRLDEKTLAAQKQWYQERGLDYAPRNQLMKQGVPMEKIAPKNFGFEVVDYGLERISRKGNVRLVWQMDRYKPYAFSVYNGVTPDIKNVQTPLRMPKDKMNGGTLEKGAILSGGDPFSPSQEVTPGVLSMVPGSNDKVEENDFNSIPIGVEGRRTEFAEWVANPRNTLTARSMVNRIWLYHFGQAIAGNPNNFGAMGKKPTHPELLDWLASEFVSNGWSVKSMHRLILSSRTYQRASSHLQPGLVEEKDPSGSSYAVFKPRRLAAEELRDSMLALTGELNPELGGIPARPEINIEVALQPRQVMGTFASAWQPAPQPERRHRRSIYALRIRGLKDPFMDVFNQPSPEQSCEMREASNVTPQVFSLFNGDVTYDRAVAMALRLKEETGSEKAAVQRAYELIFNRQATPEEVGLCLSHVAAMKKSHQNLDLKPREYPSKVTRTAVEENTGEKFQYEEHLDMYADIQPDKTMTDVDVDTRALAELCLVLFNSNEFAYIY